MLCRICQSVEVPGRECLDCQLADAKKWHDQVVAGLRLAMVNESDPTLKQGWRRLIEDEEDQHRRDTEATIARYQEATADAL